MPKASTLRIKRSANHFSDLLNHELIAWMVLAFSIVLTGLGWLMSSQAIEKRAIDRFSFEVRDGQKRIQNRINQYQQILRGGVAFFDAHTEVSRKHWQVYVSSLNLQNELPGVQGFAFAERVNQGELNRHQNRIRAEGFPAYTVQPSGMRDLYFPITLIEPFDQRNQRAFGFDMFSEPVRQEAMQYAMDTGESTISGLVQLKQGSEQEPAVGFLIYWPVYTEGADLSSPLRRREAVRGFVYSPFIASDLMKDVLGNEKIPLHFQLYDSDNMAPESLIYDSVGANDAAVVPQSEKHAQAVTVPIELSGRTWIARFESTPDFAREVHSALPNLILVAGGVIDLLLFFTIYSLVQQRRRHGAAQTKNLFLANMSHEIRTPLNAILGFNAMLGEQVKDPQAKAHVQQVREASEQLLAMVDDVLSFSQINEGTIKLESVEFDLHETVRKTLRMFAVKAQDKGIQLHCEIGQQIPLVVKGDPARFRQVLSNLISNALKFSEAGVVSVKLRTEQIGSQDAVIRTDVHDQGIGFDLKEFERLLKPFEQADNTTTRRFGGSGLGLAICQRLTELMGGELIVSSTPGQGSVVGFTFKIPAAYCFAQNKTPEEKSQEQLQAPTPEPQKVISFLGKKILVAEDNRLNQHVIHVLLTGMHAQVQLVDNGLLAVEAVMNDPSIDLVLMDIHMPVMNGIDAAIRIRKLSTPAANVPIVALTAGSTPEDEQTCFSAGMNAFMTKPVDVVKLREALAKQLFVAP